MVCRLEDIIYYCPKSSVNYIWLALFFYISAPRKYILMRTSDGEARIFFLPPMPRRVLNPRQLELHKTGTFKGLSTNWPIAPRLFDWHLETPSWGCYTCVTYLGGTVVEWSRALQLREKINENQKIPGSPLTWATFRKCVAYFVSLASYLAWQVHRAWVRCWSCKRQRSSQ